MDKKNTMLLTVIAVATLLVAVVGATFAYFTAQNSASSATNVGVQATTTATPGTVSLAGVDASLLLNMKATHMAKPTESQGTYYAVTTGDPAKDTVTNHKIAGLTTTGNEADDGTKGKYQCTYKVTVSATGLDGRDEIVAEDGAVVLSANADNTTAAVSFDNATVTLAALKTGAQTVTATIDIEGNQNAEIQAHAYIVNRNAEQDYLASLNSTIKITSATSDFSCKVVD